jgi:hypothetical protein
MKKLIFLILLFILLATSIAAAPGAGESSGILHNSIAHTGKAGQ